MALDDRRAEAHRIDHILTSGGTQNFTGDDARTLARGLVEVIDILRGLQDNVRMNRNLNQENWAGVLPRLDALEGQVRDEDGGCAIEQLHQRVSALEDQLQTLATASAVDEVPEVETRSREYMAGYDEGYQAGIRQGIRQGERNAMERIVVAINAAQGEVGQ